VDNFFLILSSSDLVLSHYFGYNCNNFNAKGDLHGTGQKKPPRRKQENNDEKKVYQKGMLWEAYGE
jgi:hypothetical protein